MRLTLLVLGGIYWTVALVRFFIRASHIPTFSDFEVEASSVSPLSRFGMLVVIGAYLLATQLVWPVWIVKDARRP